MSSKPELLSFWEKNGIVKDRRLLEAFASVPREAFVPQYGDVAYEDRPLPTIRGQTISQPTTIMVMMEALDALWDEKILEVGAGVGYQAALLAYLVGPKGRIFSMEVVPELVHIARHNMAALGYHNVTILEGDGSQGFPQESPFDKIIITAACPSIPVPLVKQTKEGGVIVAPIGDKEDQVMVKAVKRGAGLEYEFLGPFKFVPLKGKYGFEKDGGD